MKFRGTVYFDFENKDAWRLFLLLWEAEREGVSLDVRWVGFVPGGPGAADAMSPVARALAAHAAVAEPERRKVLRTGLFTLVHREGDSLADDLTLQAAARVAELDADVLQAAIPAAGHRQLVDDCARADELGVEAVPSIAREGTPLHIVTTGALQHGAARPRLEIIDGVLGDDGLWRLEKP